MPHSSCLFLLPASMLVVMDPNQPLPPLNQDHDPYNFILNPVKPKRQLLPVGHSPRQRWLFLAIAAGGLLCLLMIAYSLLTGGSSTTADLRTIAKQQNELARVASLAQGKTRSANLATFAKTTQTTMTSAQSQVTTYLATKHVKLSTKDYQKATDSSIDKKLTSADLAGQFDETFAKQLGGMLQAYQSQLEKTYKASKSPKDQALLKDLYQQADTLVNHLPAVTSS